MNANIQHDPMLTLLNVTTPLNMLKLYNYVPLIIVPQICEPSKIVTYDN